jgi:hypothetical protein
MQRTEWGKTTGRVVVEFRGNLTMGDLREFVAATGTLRDDYTIDLYSDALIDPDGPEDAYPEDAHLRMTVEEETLVRRPAPPEPSDTRKATKVKVAVVPDDALEPVFDKADWGCPVPDMA